jgi:hypothetical protein
MAVLKARSRPACAIREILDSKVEVEQDLIPEDPPLLRERQVEVGKALHGDYRVLEALPDLVSCLVIWRGRLKKSVQTTSLCRRASLWIRIPSFVPMGIP